MSKLLLGILLGLAISAGFVFMSGSNTDDINADQLCNANLDGNTWNATAVDKNLKNMTAKIKCKNGTQTETIGVDIKVGQL